MYEQAYTNFDMFYLLSKRNFIFLAYRVKGIKVNWISVDRQDTKGKHLILFNQLKIVRIEISINPYDKTLHMQNL